VTQPTIEWTPERLGRFTVALQMAPSNASVFTFEGHDFDKSYAAYLIEYLEKQFKPSRKQR
jgi:hypothetical protein